MELTDKITNTPGMKAKTSIITTKQINTDRSHILWNGVECYKSIQKQT
jgi:hypothetical protein